MLHKASICRPRCCAGRVPEPHLPSAPRAFPPERWPAPSITTHALMHHPSFTSHTT
ncbi:hypothetical protein BU23DRAFT_101112 [Bimuria novae-zelandiae CBS 107.79]|uniref:Uncharacterized protein n=1 Tax=Bimuria novae-zelandiae CBS 107.79 TaxID=1447943 RepID=A0A6A5VSM2_9PLEO|nr:hypothetical protein BU23DRAFT_101112 [Bimuria novae-zelandiae CBS 107.79]